MAESSGVSIGMQRRDLDLTNELGNLILPGDQFSLPPEDSKKVILGPGLRAIIDKETKETTIIVACKAGLLRKAKPNTYFIELKTRNYQSYKKDDILGLIKQKSKGEHYALDVACREYRAQLSKNAFEGATKRYRPDLQVGDCVFGKVMDFPKDYPLEITCVQPSGKAEGLGSLPGGHVFHVPIHFIRVLRTANSDQNLLSKIGKIVPCEIVAGVNGLVWVNAGNAVRTILVSQLLQTLSKADVNVYENYLKNFRKTLSSSGL